MTIFNDQFKDIALDKATEWNDEAGDMDPIKIKDKRYEKFSAENIVVDGLQLDNS
jgi:ABC-type phosphate transport system substrate-binding protein